MKRFITFLLAFTMLAGLGARSAFADASGEKDLAGLNSSTGEIPVEGSYVGYEEKPVYYVTVTWNQLDLKCNIEGSLSWNPHTLKYQDDRRVTLTGLESSDTTASVTVANHSNVDVLISPKLKPVDDNPLALILRESGGNWPEKQILKKASAEYKEHPTLADSATYSAFIAPNPDSSVKPDYDELYQVTESGKQAVPINVGTITITVSASTGE